MGCGFAGLYPQALPKIVVIMIVAWVLTRFVRLVTTRVLKVAERHSGGVGEISQVRTLASVIRATGIGIIFFLAALAILDQLNFNWGRCWLPPGLRAWRSGWLRRRS